MHALNSPLSMQVARLEDLHVLRVLNGELRRKDLGFRAEASRSLLVNFRMGVVRNPNLKPQATQPKSMSITRVSIPLTSMAINVLNRKRLHVQH